MTKEVAKQSIEYVIGQIGVLYSSYGNQLEDTQFLKDSYLDMFIRMKNKFIEEGIYSDIEINEFIEESINLVKNMFVVSDEDELVLKLRLVNSI